MEVVYRNNKQDKINLPKNVRQIGTEQGKRRVYIEDYAYSFIKDIIVDEDEDGAVGILLGEVQESDGVTYVFIKGVVEVTNAAVFTDRIAFTEETWPVTRKYIEHYFRDFEILGWYLCSSKITDKNMDIINEADTTSFKEPDNVFFMVNSAAGDEVFMEKSGKGLIPLSGYTVYFEKNNSMQRYMKEIQTEYDEKYSQKETDKDSDTTESVSETEGGKYRTVVKSEQNSGVIKRNLTFIYALSMLVIIVVLIIGVNKINSYDKMNGLGNDSTLEVNGTQKDEQPSKTPVTTLDGNVTEEPTTTEEPITEEPITEEPTTEEPTTMEPTTEEPTTEENKYEVYVVQKGDSLWGICVKFYGEYTPEAAEKIVSFNGLSSAEEISLGAELKIPMN